MRQMYKMLDEIMIKQHRSDLKFNRAVLVIALANQGMSKTKLAKKCGVGKDTVSHWVSGRKRPRLIMAKKIANAIGVKLTDLINRGEE